MADSAITSPSLGRTSTHLALVAAGCKAESQAAPGLAEKLAREVAAQL